MAFLPFISPFFADTHTASRFLIFLLFVFVFLLSGLHVYPLLGSLDALFLSLRSFFSPLFSLSSAFFGAADFFTSLPYSLFPFFVLFAH